MKQLKFTIVALLFLSGCSMKQITDDFNILLICLRCLWQSQESYMNEIMTFAEQNTYHDFEIMQTTARVSAIKSRNAFVDFGRDTSALVFYHVIFKLNHPIIQIDSSVSNVCLGNKERMRIELTDHQLNTAQNLLSFMYPRRILQYSEKDGVLRIDGLQSVIPRRLIKLRFIQDGVSPLKDSLKQCNRPQWFIVKRN